MYPKVKPALARAWRDLQTVQFGVTPAHAVVLGPVDTATGLLLDLIDGTRGMELLRAQGKGMGLADGRVDEVVRRLAAAGLLDDATAGGPRAQAVRARPEALARLGPDLGSLSLVHPRPGGDLRGVAARRGIRVQVRGSGRVGAVIASVLAGAGVGRVEVLDGGRAEPADVAPGGLGPGSVGRLRAEAARTAVREAAPGRPTPAPPGRPPPGPPPGPYHFLYGEYAPPHARFLCPPPLSPPCEETSRPSPPPRPFPPCPRRPARPPKPVSSTRSSTRWRSSPGARSRPAWADHRILHNVDRRHGQMCISDRPTAPPPASDLPSDLPTDVPSDPGAPVGPDAASPQPNDQYTPSDPSDPSDPYADPYGDPYGDPYSVPDQQPSAPYDGQYLESA
ncbi:ThiF family adenylyltransferase [Streptomyces sp. ICC1]|uniref:ThiF family adenylyltransferase n=1 Tax=Streptomyces sp. ICC1 TaxID=2099583 RepID=UPI001EF86057|nr:ThiF family adenylyltransferase [Streptomyces sp. ICC1]